jgi:hypothetical protein
MAFPAALSNAVDGVTEVVAIHLNNLEAKVGIDNSAVPTSLDYLVKNLNSLNPGHKHSKLWAADGSPEAVTVDAAGNVGIGTTGPGAKLEVNDIAAGATTALVAYKNSTTANSTALALYHNSAGNDRYLLRSQGDYDGSPIEALNVTAAGNVGIGTAGPLAALQVTGRTIIGTSDLEPSAKLVVQGGPIYIGNRLYAAASNAQDQVYARNPGTTTRGASFVLEARDSGSTYRYGYLSLDPDAQKMYLGPGLFSGQQVALDLTSGNVGVGTTAPGKKLDVNGYARAAGLFNTLNSAPADGDLAAGECAWWFDKTNGAAKLMIKAKQNDGTVKTASISLS